jgi:hypothetical protein
VLNQDLESLLVRKLAEQRRPPDGKLHPSGDLIGSLRHAQLRAAGAPTIESEVVSDIRLMTGTLWHTWFEQLFRSYRMPVMTEVMLDAWLPEGWSGTADWLFWDGDAFVLGDLKTIRGEGIRYVVTEGIKQEHLWQLSAYWYALENMGVPLVKGFTVFYLPQNATDGAQPLQLWGKPLQRDLVLGTMKARWERTQEYLEAVHETTHLLNPQLADVQGRSQVMRWNKTQNVFDVKLAPHWSAAYCPYPDELCDCNLAKTEKIGHYYASSDGPHACYKPRKGYEEIEPEVAPNEKELKKLNG